MSHAIITAQSCGCRGYNELRVAFGNMLNCLMKCPFCFTLDQKASAEPLCNLSKRNLANTRIIRFTGGEPLLHQEQIDGMVDQLSKVEEMRLANLDLIVVQTNALSAESRILDGLFQFKLPVIFEVSFKGTNVREYQYLTTEHSLSEDQAANIRHRQTRGYEVLRDRCSGLGNVSLLARLGIFHSSIRKPTFAITLPDTRELMFDPDCWSPAFKHVNTSQREIWGDVFEGKVVIEKIKTPADGNPQMGKRYRDIIERLKGKGLLRESGTILPENYLENYFYKRGDEIYRRCGNALRVL